LKERLTKHEVDYRNWQEGKFCYITSYRLLEYPDYYIELLEKFPCDSREELCRREGQLIRGNQCVNKNVAGRTCAQYYQDHKNELLLRRNTKENKAIKAVNNRQHYQKNKDEILLMTKKYRQKNRDEIALKYNVKYECGCGGKYTHGKKARHFRTKKHLKYIKTEN